jgi:hypothetical protein
MIDFDQSITWRTLEERLAHVDSPRQRQLVETVLAHMRTEAAADLDGLMATLVDDPQYHTWGAMGDIGPKGYDAVRTFYADFVASGAAVLQMPLEHIVIDDERIAYDGTMTTIGSWQIARERRYAIPEDGGHYLLRMRLVNLWPFAEDGRALGEDSYSAIDPNDFERIPEGELPKVYVDYLERIGREV